jgi:translation initiation factor 2 alpha subunit (eIF-2alpha)
MKKIHHSEDALRRAARALDEVEVEIYGERAPRVRTDVRGGDKDTGTKSNTCKPWRCPIPMYGIPPLPEL